MNTKTARRAVLSTSALIAASAVLVSSLTGSSSASAMPRTRVGVTPVSASSDHSQSVTAVQRPAGVHEGGGQTADPADANRRSQAIQLEPYTTPIGAVVTARSSMEAYLTASLYDVHNTWTRLFKGWNYTAPVVTFQFPEAGQVVNSCGPSDDMALQYCPTDDTVTISQELARKLWLGEYGTYTVKGTGDMSVSLFVAHEYGHNIENELGLFPGTTAAQKERGADCFAGVWAKDAAGRGILDDGDIAEGLQALDLLAEHEGQSDAGVHGTPADRQEAFGVGYNQDSRACVTTYLS